MQHIWPILQTDKEKFYIDFKCVHLKNLVSGFRVYLNAFI
jgi:hypothetical protein